MTRMLAKILILIISIPILEILILIKMGEVIGFWSTVLLVFGAGLAGTLLAKLQGFRIYQEIQQEVQAGRVPAEKLIDSLLISFAGVLLLLPGLLSDIAGILLLLPWTRFLFKRWLRKRFDNFVRSSLNGQGGDIRFFLR